MENSEVAENQEVFSDEQEAEVIPGTESEQSEQSTGDGTESDVQEDLDADGQDNLDEEDDILEEDIRRMLEREENEED